MGDRNNIQLAIGYGLGVGMVLAAISIVAGHLVLSFFGIGFSVVVVAVVVVLGGVTIAVYNALKLDREAVSVVENPSE